MIPQASSRQIARDISLAVEDLEIDDILADFGL
jgi:hypothetical protein